MATSIKVRDTTKTDLEKLQANLFLKFGKKLSQQDLIDILVRFGAGNLEKLILEQKSNKISKDNLADIFKLSEDWGVETHPDDLDDILYGGLKLT